MPSGRAPRAACWLAGGAAGMTLRAGTRTVCAGPRGRRRRGMTACSCCTIGNVEAAGREVERRRPPRSKRQHAGLKNSFACTPAYLSSTACWYCCSARLSSATGSCDATGLATGAGRGAGGGAPSGAAAACAVPQKATSSASSTQTPLDRTWGSRRAIEGGGQTRGEEDCEFFAWRTQGRPKPCL